MNLSLVGASRLEDGTRRRFGAPVRTSLSLALSLLAACGDDASPTHHEPDAAGDAGLAGDGGSPTDAHAPDGAPTDEETDPSLPPHDPCEGRICGPHGTCVEEGPPGSPARCECADGWVATDAGCEQPLACDAGDAQDPRCEPGRCERPGTLHLDVLRWGFVLPFEHPGRIEVRVVGADRAPTPWMETRALELPAWLGDRATVEARPVDASCDDTSHLRFDVRLQPAWPGAAEAQGSTALPMDSPDFVGWATEVVDVTWGDNLIERWQDLSQALGPAEGTATGIASLGEGGSIVLAFGGRIFDGEGPDFAVFENSFNETFLELAWVEVSSDGASWARFDAIYEGADGPDPFLAQPPEVLYGFAGTVRAGWGTPFDLALLAEHPDVRAGRIDLDAIRYVRIVDIVGDGSHVDRLGRPIFDPWPTHESAGFDLDAVGVVSLRVDDP